VSWFVLSNIQSPARLSVLIINEHVIILGPYLLAAFIKPSETAL
jgi:hypothetical protein